MHRSSVILLAALTLACGKASAAFPNDPYYSPYEWYGAKLNLPKAWTYSTGSPSVVVAVLDTGVLNNIPDFKDRLLPPLTSTGSAMPLDGSIDHHGTWVTSSLAMGVNNGIGGAGVGNFSLLPITVTNTNSNNSSDWIANGIRLAADRGAKVINISQSTLNYGQVNEAAAYARSKGALTIMALGNTNAQLNFGSSLDNIIFVSGTDELDGRWGANDPGGVGSSFGPQVDLSAPAHNILITEPNFASGMGLASGTSFAAPFVAGAAALAWSINPNLTPDDVQSLLYSNVDDLGLPGWDEEFGYGRINIGSVAAAAAATTVPEPASLLLLSGSGFLLLRRARR